MRGRQSRVTKPVPTPSCLPLTPVDDFLASRKAQARQAFLMPQNRLNDPRGMLLTVLRYAVAWKNCPSG